MAGPPPKGCFYSPSFESCCASLRDELGTSEPDSLGSIIAGVEWVAGKAGGVRIGGDVFLIVTQSARDVPALRFFYRDDQSNTELLFVEQIAEIDEED